MFSNRTVDAYALLSRICLGISIACLGLAYGLAGIWYIAIIFLIAAIVWLFLRKESEFWSTSFLMFTGFLLAAIGLSIHLSLPVMLIAGSASLAFWDLSNFRNSTASNRTSEPEVSLERHHLKLLLAALGTGGLLALLGSSMNLQLPFALSALLVLIAVGCLILAARMAVKPD